MILGIGTDICSIKRFEKAIQKSPLIIQRVFTPNEQKLALKSPVKKVSYFAKRFAAKEAFSKACGTGIGQNICWQDIEILNKKTGQPYVQISKKAQTFILKNFKIKKFNCHISLSDDENAIAFIILEK